MSAQVDVQIKHDLIVKEWRVSVAWQELEAEWEHAACCAEAHRPCDIQPAAPSPSEPDEWWPECCEG